MHKEIEEAREVENKCSRQWPFHDTTHPTFCELRKSHQNLLALFDRMQQEPVVEVENRDEKIFVNIDLGPSEWCKTCFLLVELRDAEHTLPYGRYRRELEDK